MSENLKVKFRQWNCIIDFGRYSLDNSLAIQLVDAEDGQSVATATVCIKDSGIEKDEVLIKDYSENEGMLKTLSDAGIVKPTGRWVKTGFVEVPVAKILVNPGI